MNPDDLPTESGTNDQPGNEPVNAGDAPHDPWAGARGAIIVIALSGLLIAGLWLISRNAPSAGTDPRLLPTATAQAGNNPFGNQTFVTVAPEPQPAPPDGTDES